MFIIELNKYIGSSKVLEDKEEWKKQEIPEKIDHPDRDSSNRYHIFRMYTKSLVCHRVPPWRSFPIPID